MSELPTALKYRVADMDRELAEARPEYERTMARVESKEYALQMLEALARIADMLDVKMGDRADLQALVMIGRIAEIVDRFRQDQKILDTYEARRQSRHRLESSAR
jgi:hypothetical protein